MRTLVAISSILFTSFANAIPAIKFTQSLRVRDVACCGARMSDITFDNVYLKTEAGDATAKVFCVGSNLTIEVVKQSYFNRQNPELRKYVEQKGSTEECRQARTGLLNISSENPLVLNML